MNLDFHVHGLLSKKSSFDEELFLNGIENAKEQGLNGFIMCEHFNAQHIDMIYKYLEEHYEYKGDRYDVNGFYVYLGMEVDVKNGGHIIVSGNREDIYAIKKVLSKYSVKPDFIPFNELLNMTESYNCLTIGSHPYREEHKLYLQSKEDLKRLDALDLNATDIFKRGQLQAEKEVQALAEELGISFVTGSDSHFPIQLGSVKSIFKDDFLTLKELKAAIKANNHSIYVSPSLKLKVYSAKITKNYIKASKKV